MKSVCQSIPRKDVYRIPIGIRVAHKSEMASKCIRALICPSPAISASHNSTIESLLLTTPLASIKATTFCYSNTRKSIGIDILLSILYVFPFTQSG